MSIKSLKRHEGYLMIDHRNSPGIPPDIARALGLNPALVAEGQILEAATITCNHCKTTFQKNPYRIRPREYCKKCDHYLCDKCGYEMTQPGYVHMTGAAVLDALQEAQHRGEEPSLSKPISIVIP